MQAYAYFIYYLRRILSRLYLKRKAWGRKTESGGWQDTAVDYPKTVLVYLVIATYITCVFHFYHTAIAQGLNGFDALVCALLWPILLPLVTFMGLGR